MNPTDPPSPPTPNDLRAGLATQISKATKDNVRGVVMTCRPGEDFVDCFHRIETEHAIEDYFFIIPPDTKMHGTEWEGGMLTRDFKYGRYSKITLFLHEDLATTSDDGARVPAFQKGQRTRYLESLVKLAQSVRWWRDYEHLADQVVMHARALLDNMTSE